MNARSFKVIFSQRLGALVAVGENATAQGKSASGEATHRASGLASAASSAAQHVGVLKHLCLAALLGSAPQAFALDAAALPTGADVRHGAATVGTEGATMTINQSTNRATINWQSFNVGHDARVNVVQNNSQSVLLNRVVGNDMSQIRGQISANGQVVLVNPNGIVMGPTGRITASAFTASTFGISDANFQAGNMAFERNGNHGKVVHQGHIQTSEAGGYVALIGAEVSNEGTIQTRQGAVVLAAADRVALPRAEEINQVSVPLSRSVRLELAPEALQSASVSNSGLIVTEGGQVLMRAASVVDAVSKVAQARVSHTGTIDTRGDQGGAVSLLTDGGAIVVTGDIHANSTQTGNKGGDVYIGRDKQTGALAASTDVSGAKIFSHEGFVETSGDHLIVDGIQIKAREWLLDPTSIEINDGGAATEATYSQVSNQTIIDALNNGTSVTVATTDAGSSSAGGLTPAGTPDVTGNLLVSGAISKTAGGDASLTLIADNNLTLNQSISSSAGALNTTLTAGGAISGTGTITTNGGTLALNSNQSTGTSGTLSGAIQTAGGGITTNVGMGGTLALAGAIGLANDGTSLTKTGQGTTVLTGTNNYSGNTTVSEGTLNVGNGGTTGRISRGTGATVSVAEGAKLVIDRSSGYLMSTIFNNSSGITGAGAVELKSGGGIIFNRAIDLTGDHSTLDATSTVAIGSASFTFFDGAKLAAKTTTLTGSGHGLVDADATVTLGRVDGTTSLSVNNNTNAYAFYGNNANTTLDTYGDVTITATYTGADTVRGAVGYGGALKNTGGRLKIIADASNSSGRIGFEAGITNVYGGTIRTLGNIEIEATAGSTFSAAHRDIGLSTVQSLGASTLTLTGKKNGVNLAGNITESASSPLTVNIKNEGASGSISGSMGTSVISGAMNLESANSITLAGNLSTGAGVTVANTGDATLSGVLSGNGGLTKTGTGKLALTGTNTYQGNTSVNQGELNIGNGGATGQLGQNSAATVTVADGALLKVQRSNAFAMSTVFGNAAGVTGQGDVTLQSGAQITLDRAIELTGSDSAIDVTSTTPTNTHAFLFSNGAKLAAPTVTMNANGSALIASNATVILGQEGGTTLVDVASNATYAFAGANANTVLDTYGDVLIHAKFTGTDSVAGAVGYGGTLKNTGGTLEIYADGSGGSGRVGFEGGITNVYSGELKVAGDINIHALKGTSTSPTHRDVVLSGMRSVGASNVLITSDGAGTQISGAVAENANSPLNLTVVSNGTSGSISGTASFNISGLLDLVSANTINLSGNIQAADGLLVSNAAESTLTGVISGDTSLTKEPIARVGQSGKLILTGANTYSGTTTIHGGVLQVGNGGTTGSLGAGDILNHGELSINRSNNMVIGQAMAGSGDFSQIGSGTTVLTADNTYTGTTTVSSGTLNVGNGGTTGTLGTGAVTNNANLIIDRSATTSALSMSTLADGGVVGNGNTTVKTGGHLLVDRSITQNGASSRIMLQAGVGQAAGNATGGDVSISQAVTTADTGTVTVFSGTPNTAALEAQITGATGSTKYKTYNASATSTTGETTGTRNYYYRTSPSVTVTDVAVSKAYDGTTALTAGELATITGTVTGAVDGDSFNANNLNPTSGSYANKDVTGDPQALTLSYSMPTQTTPGWSIAGYNATASGSTVTITQADLTQVSASKTYDGLSTVAANQMGTIAGVNGETFTATAGTANISDKNVITAGKTLTDLSGLTLTSTNGGLIGNYKLSSDLPAAGPDNVVDINAAALVLTGSRAYDGTTVVAGSTLRANGAGNEYFTITGPGDTSNLSSKNATSNGGSNTLSSVTGLSLGVGHGGADASNYNTVIDTSNSSYTVETLALTGTITPGSSTYGDALNVGTATFTNVVNGDDVTPSSVVIDTTGQTSSSGHLRAGHHTDIQGVSGLNGGDAGNYSFANVKGDYTVNKRALVASFTADDKVFDGTTTAVVAGSAPGVVMGDEVITNHTSANFDTATAGNGKTVTVAGISFAGTDGLNYEVANPSNTATTTANITPKESPKPPVPKPPVVPPTDGNGSKARVKLVSANSALEELKEDICAATNLDACYCEAAKSVEGEPIQGVNVCFSPS